MTGDKVMPKLHLRQPGFICSACGLFLKESKIHTNRYYKACFAQAYIKVCFTYDAAYSDRKDLTKVLNIYYVW